MAIDSTKSLLGELKDYYSGLESEFALDEKWDGYGFKGLFLTDVVKFILYLSSSNGAVEASKRNYLCELLDCDISEEEIAELIMRFDLSGSEERTMFLVSPFKSFLLCLWRDRHSGDDTANMHEKVIDLFRQIGIDVITSDGQVPAEDATNLQAFLGTLTTTAKAAMENEEFVFVSELDDKDKLDFLGEEKMEETMSVAPKTEETAVEIPVMEEIPDVPEMEIPTAEEAQIEAPAAEEIPAPEAEVPVMEEAPVSEEIPAPEAEVPVMDEAPVSEEILAPEVEVPVMEEAPAVDQIPMPEAAILAEEGASAVDQTPVPEEEAPMVEEAALVVEEIPMPEAEIPVPEEAPIMDEAPAVEETPIVEEIPAAEEPIAAEFEAEFEAPAEQGAFAMSIEEIFANVAAVEAVAVERKFLDISIGENGSSFIPLMFDGAKLEAVFGITGQGDMPVMLIGNSLSVACDTSIITKNVLTNEILTKPSDAVIVSGVNSSISGSAKRNLENSKTCENTTAAIDAIIGLTSQDDSCDKLNELLTSADSSIKVIKNDAGGFAVMDDGKAAHSIAEVLLKIDREA